MGAVLTVEQTKAFRTEADVVTYIISKGICGDRHDAKLMIKDMIPREGKFQDKIIKYLKTIPGAVVWKDAAGAYQASGIPDVCMILDGRFYGFEVKRPFWGRVTPTQMAMHLKMRKAGGRVHVVTYVSEVQAILADYGILGGK